MKIKIYTFILILVVLACQENVQIEKLKKLEKISVTSIDKERDLVNVFNRIKFSQSNKGIHSQSKVNFGDYSIVTDSILKVLQTDSSKYTYTFRVEQAALLNYFENLILKRVYGGYLAFVLRYEPDHFWVGNLSNFSGVIKRFDIEGNLLSEHNLADGNVVSRNDTGGRTKDCSEAIRFAYEAYDGSPCENLWDDFDDGCYLVIYIEECSSGGGGGGGGGSGSNPSFPSNPPRGGTYIPDPIGGGGSGGGGGASDGGGSEGGSSGGGSGGEDPGFDDGDPIGVIPSKPKSPEFLRSQNFRLGLPSESQLFLQANQTIAQSIFAYLETQITYTTDTEYQSAAIEFTSALINLATQQNNIILSERIINIALTVKQNGYLNKSLDANFYALIDPYIDLDLTNVEVHDQLTTYLIIKYQVLKTLNPEWSEAELLWETLKDVVHVGLDIFGLVPVIGEAADLVNGVIYTIEGDGLNATLSFGSTIPFVGYGSVATKYGLKVINAASDISSKVKLVWKVTADGVSFGSRSQLRKVLNLAPGDPRQAHHIIPWGIQGNQVVQRQQNPVTLFI